MSNMQPKQAGPSDAPRWFVPVFADFKEPPKAYSGNVMFRIQPETHRRVAVAAALEGKSLNPWAEEVLNEATRSAYTPSLSEGGSKK